jgi:hypothetical protein
VSRLIHSSAASVGAGRADGRGAGCLALFRPRPFRPFGLAAAAVTAGSALPPAGEPGGSPAPSSPPRPAASSVAGSAASSVARSAALSSSTAFSGFCSCVAGPAAAKAFQLPVPDTLRDSLSQSSAGSLARGFAQSTDPFGAGSPLPSAGVPAAFSRDQAGVTPPGSSPARPGAPSSAFFPVQPNASTPGSFRDQPGTASPGLSVARPGAVSPGLSLAQPGAPSPG